MQKMCLVQYLAKKTCHILLKALPCLSTPLHRSREITNFGNSFIYTTGQVLSFCFDPFILTIKATPPHNYRQIADVISFLKDSSLWSQAGVQISIWSLWWMCVKIKGTWRHVRWAQPASCVRNTHQVTMDQPHKSKANKHHKDFQKIWLFTFSKSLEQFS